MYLQGHLDTKELEVIDEKISRRLQRRVVEPFIFLDCDWQNHSVLIENQGLGERHNLDRLILRFSGPPAKTTDDQFVTEQIVGHTQGSTLEREYKIRWLVYTPEQDNFHKTCERPWHHVV